MEWTKEEKEYFLENYGKIDTEEMAKHMGKTPGSLRQYACRHRISANRFWTKEEEEYLYDHVGSMSLRAIAKKLKKPYRTVLQKNTYMGYGRFWENCNNEIHLAEVSRLVGRDKESIKKSWVNHGLVIKKKGKFSIIRISNLIKVMRENPMLWDALDCDYDFFHKYDFFLEQWETEYDIMVKERHSIERRY